MKTLLPLLVISTLLTTSLSFAQITINESAIKSSKKEDAANTSYFLNLPKLQNDSTIQVNQKTILDSLTKFKKEPAKEIIKLSYQEVESLKKISPETSAYFTSDENSDENDPFFYDFYEKKLELAKEELRLKESTKKTITDKDKLNKLRAEIKEKRDEVNKYKIILKKYDEINYNQSKKDMWMPSAEEDKRESFFNSLYSKDSERNSYLLNNVAAQIGSNSTAVSSELITSYFKWVRASFGTVMTNADTPETASSTSKKVDEPTNTDETNAFQRLLSSGGGNLYLNFELPFYYLQSRTFTMYFNSNARTGVVLKEFSRDIDTATGNGNVGLNLYASLSSDDKKSFLFFFNSNFGGYGGGTDFYKQLNLSNNKVFAFGQATIGLDIAKAIRVSYTVGTFGSDENLRSKHGIVGIQLLKGLFD